MSILSEILDDIFKVLSITETVNRNPQKDDLSEKNCFEVWKIDSEVQERNFQREINFYIYFDEYFPISIPRVYLSQKSYDDVKYIPHVDKDRLICIFHTEELILDQNNPLGIVQVCLKKAKKIISDGLNKTNFSDFQDEFGAYWTDNNENDTIQYLSLVTDFPKENQLLKILKLNKTYNRINYLLYNENSPTSKLFMDFLSQNGYIGTSSDALYLADIKIDPIPPFSIDNEFILNTLSTISLTTFKRYINSPKIIEKYIFFLATTTTNPILIGWKHRMLITNRKGFRNGILSPFEVLSKLQKKDKVIKILLNEYSNNRIEKRTSGVIYKKYNFLIAGLGSIGSNLIFFLNGINYPDFKFIDSDSIKIENIGRHLLGINDINKSKTEALKTYIKNIRPDQNVLIKNKNLESIVLKNITFFNDCTYAFIAIGNQNVENLILSLHVSGIITVPMFFLWVEPYALGGHCVFLHPEDKVTMEELYEQNLYRFNIIDPLEYVKGNPILSKQEAGCQTAFMPYSENDILLFLSSIYKLINNIIHNDIKQSQITQWVGNVPFALEMGITLNEKFSTMEPYCNETLILHNGN